MRNTITTDWGDGMKKGYDWEKIKNEYLSENLTAAQLARKHNVSISTLRYHLKKENWEREKNSHETQVSQNFSKEMKIADKLADVLDEAISDKKQFYRYIVKEKDGTNVSEEEKIFDKMDMQSLNNAIKALSSLEEIKRAMQGILSPLEERKMQLSRAGTNDEGEENETGVVILPAVKED